MSRDDWFRSADWDADAQELFQSKLERSRTRHTKAQYLWIKGSILGEQADEARRDAGRSMLRDVIANYGDQSSAPLCAYFGLARSYEVEGLFAAAADLYADCVRSSQELKARGIHHSYPSAPLAMIEMCMCADQMERAAEAMTQLEGDTDALRSALTFNTGRFRYYVACARINLAQGSNDDAVSCAEKAMELAANPEPQLPRHPTVGIVHASDELLTELRSIVASARGVAE